MNSSIDRLLAQSYYLNTLPNLVEFLTGFSFDDEHYSLLQQINLPKFLNGLEFVQIFDYFALIHNIIVIGVYRGKNKNGNILEYVYCNPKPHIIINDDDKLFIINPINKKF
jgi:hypothetical protein